MPDPTTAGDDPAVALCRQGGFSDILLRGDTDFSLTSEFDRFDADGLRFIFGYDARANLVERAGDAPDDVYHDLVARAEGHIATRPRTRPRNVKTTWSASAATRCCARRAKRSSSSLTAGQVQQGLPGGGSRPTVTTSSGGACSPWSSAPSSGLHRPPLPDRQHGPNHPLAHPSLEPLAGTVLPSPRRSLTPRTRH